jgi:hypothetical protein
VVTKKDITQSVTSVPETLHHEQVARIHRYLLTLGVRTVCFVLAVVTDGWVRWVFAGLAIVLPYIAVVMANAVRPRRGGPGRPVTPHRDSTHQITQ